jgi:hypothetical protein
VLLTNGSYRAYGSEALGHGAWKLYYTESPDGFTWSDDAAFVDSPSAYWGSDVVQLPNGSFRLYYVRGHSGGVGVARSAGGSEFERIGAVPGAAHQPDVARLPDGSWLLVTAASHDAAHPLQWHELRLATSADGFTWRLQPRPVVETSAFLSRPALVPLDDGRIRLYYVLQKTKTAKGALVSGVLAQVPSKRLRVVVQGRGEVVSVPRALVCRSACFAAFAAGETVNLTAVPAKGYRFDRWTAGCSGTGRCGLTLANDAIVRARFARR